LGLRKRTIPSEEKERTSRTEEQGLSASGRLFTGLLHKQSAIAVLIPVALLLLSLVLESLLPRLAETLLLLWLSDSIPGCVEFNFFSR